MEADGVPLGFDRWRKVGVVRNPIDRLWSLYKYIKHGLHDGHDMPWLSLQRNSVNVPFDEWVRTNQVVFTSPFDAANSGRWWPDHCVKWALPENRKSQWIYLRPDLGTMVFPYSAMSELGKFLDVPLSQYSENRTVVNLAPHLSAETTEYMSRAFAWDFEACEPFQIAAE
jgi:hypothetical protein